VDCSLPRVPLDDPPDPAEAAAWSLSSFRLNFLLSFFGNPLKFFPQTNGSPVLDLSGTPLFIFVCVRHDGGVCNLFFWEGRSEQTMLPLFGPSPSMGFVPFTLCISPPQSSREEVSCPISDVAQLPDSGFVFFPL